MNRIRGRVTYPAQPKPEPVTKAANRAAWTLDDDMKIEELSPQMSWREIGAVLGRSRQAVRVRAYKVGIVKGAA